MTPSLRERTFVGRFLAGACYPFHGLKLIFSDKRILLLSIVPFIFTLVVYSVLFIISISLVDNIANLLIEPGTWWRSILRWAMMISLPVILLVLLVFTYAFVSFVIAAPFYEFLSAAVEKKLAGEVKEEPFSLRNLVVDIWRALIDSAILLIIELFVLAFGLVFGPVSMIMCFVISALLMALENLDHVMGRRRMKFAEKIRYAGRNFWTMLGFGLIVLSGLLIPFLGVLFLPMGVAGGTKLFCDIQSELESPS